MPDEMPGSSFLFYILKSALIVLMRKIITYIIVNNFTIFVARISLQAGSIFRYLTVPVSPTCFR
jgi:hypothetical protein